MKTKNRTEKNCIVGLEESRLFFQAKKNVFALIDKIVYFWGVMRAYPFENSFHLYSYTSFETKINFDVVMALRTSNCCKGLLFRFAFSKL